LWLLIKPPAFTCVFTFMMRLLLGYVMDRTCDGCDTLLYAGTAACCHCQYTPRDVPDLDEILTILRPILTSMVKVIPPGAAYDS
jgi:hypothetical protein